MTVWQIDLPITRPLNLNGREHWRVKAKAVKQIRETTAALVRQAKVPTLNNISVELHYVPRDKRRRDPLNLVATLKPIEDGIVDAGVVPDDTPKYVKSIMPIIDECDSSNPRIYFLIRDNDSEL